MSINKRKITGQGMTEYIIIVALIAIAAIGVFTAFGDVVRAQVGTMAASLGGATSTEATDLRTQGVEDAGTKAETKGLDGYEAN